MRCCFDLYFRGGRGCLALWNLAIFGVEGVLRFGTSRFCGVKRPCSLEPYLSRGRGSLALRNPLHFCGLEGPCPLEPYLLWNRGALDFETLRFCGIEGALRFGTLRLCGVEGALRSKLYLFRGRGGIALWHTQGDMLQRHVAGKNFMRCSLEGACCGDRFLEVLTRRVLSQGHIVISFSEWFIFLKCRGIEGPWTSACNVILSPRHVPAIQNDLNSGDMSRGQNFVPAARFFMKIERSHDGICRPCNMSPRVCQPLSFCGVEGALLFGTLRFLRGRGGLALWNVTVFAG